jgi:hypothetical protein
MDATRDGDSSELQIEAGVVTPGDLLTVFERTAGLLRGCHSELSAERAVVVSSGPPLAVRSPSPCVGPVLFRGDVVEDECASDADEVDQAADTVEVPWACHRGTRHSITLR